MPFPSSEFTPTTTPSHHLKSKGGNGNGRKITLPYEITYQSNFPGLTLEEIIGALQPEMIETLDQRLKTLYDATVEKCKAYGLTPDDLLALSKEDCEGDPELLLLREIVRLIDYIGKLR